MNQIAMNIFSKFGKWHNHKLHVDFISSECNGTINPCTVPHASVASVGSVTFSGGNFFVACIFLLALGTSSTHLQDSNALIVRKSGTSKNGAGKVSLK